MCRAWYGAMQMYADEARAATRKEMKKEMKRNEKTGQRKKIAGPFLTCFLGGIHRKKLPAISELPLKKVQKMCEGFIKNTTMAVHTS